MTHHYSSLLYTFPEHAVFSLPLATRQTREPDKLAGALANNAAPSTSDTVSYSTYLRVCSLPHF